MTIGFDTTNRTDHARLLRAIRDSDGEVIWETAVSPGGFVAPDWAAFYSMAATWHMEWADPKGAHRWWEGEALSEAVADPRRWRGGSRVEILPGTVRAFGGPHPPTVHADEVELMSEDVWRRFKGS